MIFPEPRACSPIDNRCDWHPLVRMQGEWLANHVSVIDQAIEAVEKAGAVGEFGEHILWMTHSRRRIDNRLAHAPVETLASSARWDGMRCRTGIEVVAFEICRKRQHDVVEQIRFVNLHRKTGN